MSTEIVQRLTGVISDFDRRVRATAAADWGNSTPCTEWCARDIVDHVGNNLLRFTAALQGAQAGQIDAAAEIVDEWTRARDGFLAVLPGADLAVNVPPAMGPMTMGEFLGRFIVSDILVHTWDLARAVGGDEHLDPAFIASAYEGLKPMDENLRHPSRFGPKIVVDGADLQTEFLSFLGRAV